MQNQADEPKLGHSWHDYLFLMTRLWIVFGMGLILSDIHYYLKVAMAIDAGQAPYVDFLWEYPYLTIVQIMLPGFLGFSLHYGFGFRLTCLLMECLVYLKLRKRVGVRNTLFFTIGGLLLAPYLYDRFDLWFTSFIFFWVISVSSKVEWRQVGIFFVGFAFKFVNIILLPLVFIRSGIQGLKVYALGFLSFLIISLGLFGINALNFFSYHRDRGIQIESLWSTWAYVWTRITGELFVPIHSYGSYNVAPGPGVISASEAGIICIITIVASLLWSWHKKPPFPVQCAVVLLTFTLFNKVLSPQYFVWFLPLISICYPTRSRRDLSRSLIFLLIFGLGTAVFMNYMAFVGGDVVMWSLVIARNLLVIVGLVLMLQDFSHPETVLTQHR